ncbi:hypothetical protein SAMN04487913_10724 [Arthrobacter sp. ok362]|nr:hypothetical protein SAMN04487913_10724 [Arthrobacter sp. ok362]
MPILRRVRWTYGPHVHWLRAGEDMSICPVRTCPALAMPKGHVHAWARGVGMRPYVHSVLPGEGMSICPVRTCPALALGTGHAHFWALGVSMQPYVHSVLPREGMPTDQPHAAASPRATRAGHVHSWARGVDIRAVCPAAAATGGHAHFPNLRRSSSAGSLIGTCPFFGARSGQPEQDMSILGRGEWTLGPYVQRLRPREGMSIGQPHAAASPRAPRA